MSLSREKLVNISIFLSRAAKAPGTFGSIEEVMAFAETVQAVNDDIVAIDKKAPPKSVEPAKPAAPTKVKK